MGNSLNDLGGLGEHVRFRLTGPLPSGIFAHIGEVQVSVDGRPVGTEDGVGPDGGQVTVSGTGNWTRDGYDKFHKKFYAGDSTKMLCRIGNLAAASGQIKYEEGPIIVSSLTQKREKGQVVTASITLDFARTPTITLAP